MDFLLPRESASEIVGNNTTESELVIVEGKLIKAMDIPVRIPYVLKAKLWDIPNLISIIGIRIDSILLNKLIVSLFTVSGTV